MIKKYLPKRLSDVESFFIYCFFSIFFSRYKKKKFKWHEDKNKPNRRRLFIFGSGHSLTELSSEEWQEIRKSGDTMSFNDFYYSTYINLDYYIFREVESKYFSIFSSKLRKRMNSVFNISKIRSIIKTIKDNRCMKDTNYFFLCDKKS